MPTNFACPRQPTFPRPKKRPLSFDMEQYLHEPVHKVYISEKFANDLAAMSLNHREERSPQPVTVTTTATTPTDTPEYQAYVIEEEESPQPGKDQKSVVVVDDINDFLSSDDETDENTMDTDYALPMQKRPGDNKYRIPDFVLQSDQGSKSLREFVLGRKSPEPNTKPKGKHVIVLNSDRLTPAMHIDDSDNTTSYTFNSDSHYADYNNAAPDGNSIADTDVASMDVD
ncbi:hypothetical protein NQZ79_g7263 [Umbelopsis isabellina]|nr:hypothetical protein NQZ79_g7263 [Umbelopsis isabellina]